MCVRACVSGGGGGGICTTRWVQRNVCLCLYACLASGTHEDNDLFVLLKDCCEWTTYIRGAFITTSTTPLPSQPPTPPSFTVALVLVC